MYDYIYPSDVLALSGPALPLYILTLLAFFWLALKEPVKIIVRLFNPQWFKITDNYFVNLGPYFKCITQD